MSIWGSGFAAMNAASLRIAGVSITYTPMSPPAAAVTVTGIFTNPRNLPDYWPGQYHGVEVRTADLPRTARAGDLVQLGDDTFTVFDISDPGDGMQKLRLSKNS